MNNKKYFFFITFILLLSIVFNFYQANKLKNYDKRIVYLDHKFSESLLKISESLENNNKNHTTTYALAYQYASFSNALAEYTSYAKKTDQVHSYSSILVTRLQQALISKKPLKKENEIAQSLKKLSSNPIDPEELNRLSYLLTYD